MVWAGIRAADLDFVRPPDPLSGCCWRFTSRMACSRSFAGWLAEPDPRGNSDSRPASIRSDAWMPTRRAAAAQRRTGLNTRLLDPTQAHRRTYWVRVERIPSPESPRGTCPGTGHPGRRTLPARAWMLSPAGDRSAGSAYPVSEECARLLDRGGTGGGTQPAGAANDRRHWASHATVDPAEDRGVLPRGSGPGSWRPLTRRERRLVLSPIVAMCGPTAVAVTLIWIHRLGLDGKGRRAGRRDGLTPVEGDPVHDKAMNRVARVIRPAAGWPCGWRGHHRLQGELGPPSLQQIRVRAST